MAGWWAHGGLLYHCLTFACSNFSIIKCFLKSISALMWSFMESIDIKKGFFFCGKLFTIHRWMKKSSCEAICKYDFNSLTLKNWVRVCVCVCVCVCVSRKRPSFQTLWRCEWWLPPSRRNGTIFIFFILYICISNESIFLLLSTQNIAFKTL